jgi:arginase
MKHNICILEFPSNLGLKALVEGKEPGVKKLPAFLRQHGFHASLNPAGTTRLEPPAYSMELDEISGVRNADMIVQYATAQAGLVEQALAANEFPIVLGGDCSILIGNALALKNRGSFALFSLDGHTDFVLPSLSETAGAAGMDLAIVTGYGHHKLTDIGGQKPYFKEGHTWCVGNRYFEEEEYVQAIVDSGIHYTDLTALRKEGIEQCVAGFLQMVKDNNLDGFWIHIDVDVLNDDIMPAVDSRQADGLSYAEFNELIRLLLSDRKATGLQITILDPDLDPAGTYTKAFVDNFCNTVNSTRATGH